MYELIKLTENDYYIDCPAKTGLVKISENEVILIDSGSDKDAAKKILRVINDNGWSLKAVYNTHSHADHIGGNRFLREKTNCEIYSNGIGCAFTRYPVLEPSLLFGGMPFKELRHKFLMAQESEALPLTEDTLPPGMKIISLPGHSMDMVGFITKDLTAYIGDSVSSAETIKKYGITYLWDVAASLDTLEKLPEIPAKRFVPAHAPVTEDISPLAKENILAINEAAERILDMCNGGLTFEKILKNVFSSYSLTMTAQQYALIGSTVRSYLSCLYSQGKLNISFSDNEMLWQTAEE